MKVLQSVYAMYQDENSDLDKQEKFLGFSMDQMLDLYALMLQLMVALRDQAETFLVKSQQKFLATDQEKNPSRTFVDNKVIALLAKNKRLSEVISKKNLNYWAEDDEYVNVLFKSLKDHDMYYNYLSQQDTTFNEDRDFLIRMYKEVIAPNEKLYDYLEDKRLTWLDDFPLVNTAIVKMLSQLSPKNADFKLVPSLYKNDDDKDFSIQLLRKVILNDEMLTDEIDGKTPNWDKERIAEIDMIILKMGISEFLYFPSIPVRATINEYLEISKEYSTPKSSLFINGILDKLVKDYEEAGKLNKIGRGLR